MDIERRRHGWIPVAVSGVLFVAALALLPWIGSTPLDAGQVWRRQQPALDLFLYLRVPQVLVAMLAGGCLALCGALFQALLRDSLATPYTLGVSSGASLGAVLMISLGLPAVWIGSFAGSAGVLVLVLGIASEGRRVSSFTLLLAGVAVNSLCGSLILFVHYFAGWAESFSISRWLMGGIEPIDYLPLSLLTAVCVAAAFAVIRHGAEWNALAVGEEWALARGVEVRRMLVTGYLAGSLLTGLVTAVTGPIGFVGLIVPHMLRLRWGPDHRMLLPCSFLAGAAFLAACDAAARTILAPALLPVGVITSLLGAPFFIWLLRTRRRTFWT